MMWSALQRRALPILSFKLKSFQIYGKNIPLDGGSVLLVQSHGIYRVFRGECATHQENVPYVKVHRYNPKHLYPKLNGYGDNGDRSLKV